MWAWMPNVTVGYITWDSGGGHSPHLEPKIWTPGQFGLQYMRREPWQLDHTSAGQTQNNKYDLRLLLKHNWMTLKHILIIKQQCYG